MKQPRPGVEVPPSSIVVLTADELRALVEGAVRSALAARDAEEDRPLSAREVAKRARRRMGDVCAALANGALPARRSGRAWHVRPSDCAEWITRGCPISP